jgi:hypothetical protein
VAHDQPRDRALTAGDTASQPEDAH